MEGIVFEMRWQEQERPFVAHHGQLPLVPSILVSVSRVRAISVALAGVADGGVRVDDAANHDRRRSCLTCRDDSLGSVDST